MLPEEMVADDTLPGAEEDVSPISGEYGEDVPRSGTSWAAPPHVAEDSAPEVIVVDTHGGEEVVAADTGPGG